MVTGRLPDEGPLQIGSVSLPAGARIVSGHGTARPVAWATTEPVPDAGRVWAALSEAHAQSGLVPLLLAGIGGDPERPWDRQEFRDPDDLAELDHLDAAELLREDWLRQTTEYDDYDEEDEEYHDDDFARSIAQEVAPFSRRQFPGLAAVHPRVSPAPGRRALGVLQRIRRHRPARRPRHHGEPDELTHLDLLVGLRGTAGRR